MQRKHSDDDLTRYIWLHPLFGPDIAGAGLHDGDVQMGYRLLPRLFIFDLAGDEPEDDLTHEMRLYRRWRVIAIVLLLLFILSAWNVLNLTMLPDPPKCCVRNLSGG